MVNVSDFHIFLKRGVGHNIATSLSVLGGVSLLVHLNPRWQIVHNRWAERKGQEVWGPRHPWGPMSWRPTVGDFVVWPRRVQNGLGENADVLLVFTSQSEERKRIDELIESGKEEGMKVRAAGPTVEAKAARSERFVLL